MSITSIACTSQRALRNACLQQVQSLLLAHHSVDILVGSSVQVALVKKHLAAQSVVGVQVNTIEHWLDSQWELWGDGTKLVNAQQRHLLLRPALAALCGLEPSSTYLDQFSAFVQDACALGASVPDADIAKAIETYMQSLEEHSLAEPYAQLDVIAAAQAGRAIVFYGVDLQVVRYRRLADLLDNVARLVMLERVLPCQTSPAADDASCAFELDALRQLLFSGQGGLAPQGCFKAAEVLGTHAENAAVARLVKDALAHGAEPGQVAVVFPSASSIPAGLPAHLAQEGLPVRASLRTTVQQTSFGSAFLQLERLLGKEDDGYVNTMAFACSVYSGLDDKTARGFAAAWRAQAGSTHEARLKDLTCGIKGRVSSKGWDVKLARLRKLLESDGAANRVRLMFDNARYAGLDAERLFDDAACAEAILDHIELCASLGQEVSLADIAALPVRLDRVSDGQESCVLITDASQAAVLEGVEHVVFARLDMDSYPMSASPSPFDLCLQEMGAKLPQGKALVQRIRLLDAIEAAGKGFSCYRLTHSKEGEETCQSALWDELMSAYRTDADADAPVHALPAALLEADCALRICEADEFKANKPQASTSFEAVRAQVAQEAHDLLFPDFDTYKEAFSPTALEDYYRCPYRWFVCRRIGANSLDKPFDQIAKGNLAHAVLERFYLDLAQEGIERVTPDNLPDCLVIANASFDWQLNHEIERHRLNLTCERDMQEAQVVRKQVLDLVKRDANFLPGFKPTFLELKLEDPDGAPMTYAGVHVRGKVDRIDVDASGRAVVIDYKLSGLASGYGLAADDALPTRIQTDIYALLVERCLKAQGVEVSVVGSVYRSYSKNMLRGVYDAGIDWGSAEVTRTKLDGLPGAARLQGYREYLAQVEATVEGLLKKMREGDIAARPLCADACEYCLAAGFCDKGGKA